jgi:hypothetical protein
MTTNIIIKHVPTNMQVEFEPYLTKFADNFKSDWQQNFVIGRMDPISNFKRTTRTISIGFDLMCSSPTSAQFNKTSLENLASFLYPVYKETKTTTRDNITINANDLGLQNGTLQPTTESLYKVLRVGAALEEQLNLRPNVAIMSSSPIVSIKFSNMISDTQDGPLFGYIDGLNINPMQDVGFLVLNDKIYPKGYNVDFNFTVIHSEPLGWKVDNKKRGGPFKG